MKRFFGGITGLSLRFRAVTLILGVLISVAGVVAVTQLRQELIPSVEFPQTTILAQTSGLTSEQVLNVLTNRIETALDEQVAEISNLESTTTGSFGALVTAYNDFGQNQVRLRDSIQASLDSIWLPVRRIQPPEGTNPADFIASMLSALPADVLLYLAERDSNFLFQLSPDVWAGLSNDTINTLAAYLAGQQEQNQSTNALRQLIEQEISPALINLPDIARVDINGGQQIPGEGAAQTEQAETVAGDARSLLLKLSPEVWAVISQAALDEVIALDDAAAARFEGVQVTVPERAPALPDSWQIDNFRDATDLAEMRTLTRSLGAVFNGFAETGRIVGSLGQTDDLSPETITQMLALDPTMVEYFQAEHLAAMTDDVFAALPDDFIAGLDGFTRDQLAAKALAVSISGQTAAPVPVDLPTAWRISPPQLITFSFDDLPLATFSVAGTGVLPTAAPSTAESEPVAVDAATSTETVQDAPAVQDIPEGPELPALFGVLGAAFGVELDSADDLIGLELPESAAAQFGASSLPAAQLFNFLALLADPENLPAGVQLPPIPINPAGIVGSMEPEVFTFIAEYDPDFLPTLSAQIYDWMSDDALAVPELAPPLDGVWDNLANQPQFANAQLETARDIVTLGDGSPAQVLNTINDSVPDRFAGYDVRLFDSLTPGTLRYFAAQQNDFFAQLNPEVLAKLAPATLAVLPEAVIAALEPETAAALASIAAGETPSAAETLASLYETNVPPADPNAPPLNADWAFIGDFVGVELDSADDFFRFFPDPATFFNSFFNSAQGASFAPNLFGGWTPEVVAYINERDAAIWDNVRPEVLNLIGEETRTVLPAAVQERLASGEAPFVPTDAITRTDGLSSMFVTVYKTGDANTVQAFHEAEAVMERIDEADENITVSVGFEQASFIEESINGVAREGGLGAIFAILVILVFLSGGTAWRRGSRALVGAVLVAVFLGLLGLIVVSNAGAFGGDLNAGFENTDVVVRVLLIGGVIIGLGVILFPGNLPRPAWRSTLVTAISIPLSVLMALALMRWLPPAVHGALENTGDTSAFTQFMLRLFPASITINIMTLSGLTVAIGRVVDDSIVVLENIFRQIQEGGDRRQAIITGTRDVSVAIFAATVITVVVFLPLGLTGGVISEFFLPFGLAVTYSLLASFIVAITVVPVVAYLLLDASEVSHEHEQSWLEKIYLPVLKWALSSGGSRAIVIALALVSLVIGFGLLAQRPVAFLPSFGEPQIAVTVNLPAGTPILETNARVEEFEAYAESIPGEAISRVQTLVGSAGFTLQSLLLGGGGVTENIASITLGVEGSEAELDALTGEVRAEAERIFGEGAVTVSAASLSEQGLGGFELVLAGDQDDLLASNPDVIRILTSVEGLANISSNLDAFGAGSGDTGPATYIRINGNTAVEYTGELETQNTIGVTQQAIDALRAAQANGTIPASITISQGFNSELQTQGVAGVVSAGVIAIVLVVVILIITFGSLVHWIDIISSILVAPVGAAILLTLADRVLGISAMIGLLMLIGIVVTNAVVLIDRVQANRRERKMNVRDALIEAGDRRLRPILMTAIATIFALLPLAIGLSEGAIIASELGTVVIGGLFSSTLLTLILVPVLYSILAGVQSAVMGERKNTPPQAEVSTSSAD
ncbi:MAG: efflux RND transporter permease subunit [bacterium]|nr:efflux RND transporter permease subunit [bacterium]